MPDTQPTETGGIATQSPLIADIKETSNQSGAFVRYPNLIQYNPDKLKNIVRNTKTLSISKELRHQLNQKPRGSKKTYCELLVTNTLKKAIQGDARLIKEIFDRVDGLPTQKIHFEAEIKVNELAETLRAICNNAPLPDIIDGQIEELREDNASIEDKKNEENMQTVPEGL
jgi:hypothetical protein